MKTKTYIGDNEESWEIKTYTKVSDSVLDNLK